MPYVGKKPADIIATAVDTTTGTFSGDIDASTVNATGDTAAGDNAAIGFTSAEGLILTGQGSTSDITVKNDADATVFTVPTGTDDILFPDNAKAMFGAGSDLQIFHDGTNSNIKDAGTGSLNLIASTKVQVQGVNGETMAIFNEDGSAELRHNDVKKFETTSGGVTVTGDIANASGDLTIDVAGDIILDADGAEIKLSDGGTQFANLYTSSSDFYIQSSVQDKDIIFQGNDGGSGITALTLDMSEAGDATFNNRAVFNSNVSIGTTSFPSKFTVSNAGTDNIIETANTTNSVRGGMQADTSVVAMGAITNHPLVFRTNNGERARINADGHLYVNTSGAEPSSSQVGVRVSGTQGQNFWKSANSGTGGYDQLTFHNGNGQVGAITTNGSNTSYATSSDYRLKENVTYDFDATTRLKQLKPSRFNFIADKDTTVDGFLAHEVQSVVPEAISGEKDAMAVETRYTEDDVETQGDNPTKSVGDVKTYSTTEISPQGIDQSKLVPLLVKSLQEALTEIDTLKTKVAALENA